MLSDQSVMHEWVNKDWSKARGIETTDYATVPDILPQKQVKIHNPGFILVVSGDTEGISTPNLERVDYVALA